MHFKFASRPRSILSVLLVLAVFLVYSPVVAALPAYTATYTFNLTTDLSYLRPTHPRDYSIAYNYFTTYYTATILEANIAQPNEQDYFNYKTLNLYPAVSGTYYIEATDDTLDDENGDTMFWLYEGSFDPENPLENVLAVNDDGGDAYYSNLSEELDSSKTYILVVTTYDFGTEGTVTLSIGGPGTLEISEEEPPAEDQEPSRPRVAQKRDPITVSPGMVGNVQTTDLSYLVAIPEQWMADVTYVEFWFDATPVTAQTEGYAYIDTAQSTLMSANSKLLDTFQVDLMQRVSRLDKSITTSKFTTGAIRGNFTIRLPIPAALAATPDLGIVYIEDNGLTANLASKIITMDGVSYIEFQNNRPAVYGFVSDPANAATR